MWGFDFNSFSNVVDVHIKNIRRKLKAKNIPETIRGIGYRIQSKQMV
jgi:DNA-binding response OmpR family regulator